MTPFSLWQALVFGWEMALFYLLLIGYGIVFVRHVMRPAQRWLSLRLLISITALVGLLAPAHAALRSFSEQRVLTLSGWADPVQWGHTGMLIHTGTCLITATAAGLVLMTLWASLLPLAPR